MSIRVHDLDHKRNERYYNYKVVCIAVTQFFTRPFFTISFHAIKFGEKMKYVCNLVSTSA